MVNEADMQAALADLRVQWKPNIPATAAKYNLVYTTLLRRFKGETTSKEVRLKYEDEFYEFYE
jgi:hypothetical protein